MSSKSKSAKTTSNPVQEEEEEGFSNDESGEESGGEESDNDSNQTQEESSDDDEGGENEDDGSVDLTEPEEEANEPLEEEANEPEEPEEEPVKEPVKKTSIHISKPASRPKTTKTKTHKKKTPPRESKSPRSRSSSPSRSASLSPIQTRPPPTQKPSNTRKSSVPRTRKPGTKTFVARKELTYLNKVKKAALGQAHGYTIGELRSFDTSKGFSKKLSHRELAKAMYELEIKTVLARAENETGEPQRESYGNILSTLGVKGVKTNNIDELKRLIDAKLDDYNVANNGKDIFDPSRPCSGDDKTNKDPFAYSNAILKSLAKIRGIQASKLNRQQLCDALKATAPSSKAKSTLPSSKKESTKKKTPVKALPTKTPTRKLLDILGERPEVSTFNNLLSTSPKALSFLKKDAVVVAPDNESFNLLPDGLLDYLKENNLTDDILLQHIIPGVKSIDTNESTVTAANGSLVDTEIFTGGTDFQVLTPAISASNGSVYIIRGILQSERTAEFVDRFLLQEVKSKSRSPSPKKSKGKKSKLPKEVEEILTHATAPQSKKSQKKSPTKKKSPKKSPIKETKKKSPVKETKKSPNRGRSVAELISRTPSISTFQKLLVEDGRPLNGHITAFVPSDDALTNTRSGYLASLLNDNDERAPFISNHLVVGVVTPGDFDIEEEGGTGSITTIAGNNYTLSYENGNYFVNDYPVILTEHGQNGYVYVIDGILEGEQGPSTVSEILGEASEQENINTFLEALDASGLANYIPDKPIVVYIPSDDAFDELPAGALVDLLANKEELASFLKKHIVYAPVGTGNVTTLGGTKISIKDDENGYPIPDGANIVGSGPSYYIIDKVLAELPKGKSGRKSKKAAAKSASKKKSPKKSPPKKAPTPKPSPKKSPKKATPKASPKKSPVKSKPPSPKASPKKSPKKPVPKTTLKKTAASKPQQKSIQDLLSDASNHLTILNELIAIAGFVFDPAQTYTVFAPNDDAFKKLGKDKLQELRNLDQEGLTGILANHLLGEAQTTEQLSSGLTKKREANTFPTLGDYDATITKEKNTKIANGIPTIAVNGIPIIIPDIRATNGIVDIIGQVITASVVTLEHIPSPKKGSKASKKKSPVKETKKASPKKSPPKKETKASKKKSPVKIPKPSAETIKVSDAFVEQFLNDLGA